MQDCVEFQFNTNERYNHRLTNAHFARVIRFHPDMPSAHDHVPPSMHSNRLAVKICKFCNEFSHAVDGFDTIQQSPDHSVPQCVHLFEPIVKRKLLHLGVKYIRGNVHNQPVVE